MSNEELGKEMSKQDQRKKYTAEFRANAVRLVTELGLTNEMVAQRLGCTAESVRRWVMAHRRAMRPIQLQNENAGQKPPIPGITTESKKTF